MEKSFCNYGLQNGVKRRRRMGEVKIRNVKRKLAFLLTAAMIFGMNMAAYASETQAGSAGISRRLEAEGADLAAKGEKKRIIAYTNRRYDQEKFEFYSDEEHPVVSLAEGPVLTGNTSRDTKLVDTENILSGQFDSFSLQVGEDEEADELTISVKLGAWGYYLRDKETGEIIYVTGNVETWESERSVTIKVKNEVDEFTFNRGLMADKTSVGRGRETAVRMRCQWVYNQDKFTPYSDTDGHSWYLGMKNCTVSGNTCEGTRIEDRKDYSNTRYLVVDEEEKADELTITMECGNWHYWVKDKVTNELIRIYGDDSETFTMTIKVGEETAEDTGYDADSAEKAGEIENERNTYEQPSVEVPSDKVTGQDGKTAVSTVGGVYRASNVAGIAVLTPREQVETAAGIQNSESGENVRFYVCNSVNGTAKTILEQAAVQAGRNVITTLNMDMYVISAEGKVNKVGTASSKIRIVIGLPERCRNTEQEYRIGIMGEDGKFYQLEDLDNDKGTITIETDKFGIMALMG